MCQIHILNSQLKIYLQHLCLTLTFVGISMQEERNWNHRSFFCSRVHHYAHLCHSILEASLKHIVTEFEYIEHLSLRTWSPGLKTHMEFLSYAIFPLKFDIYWMKVRNSRLKYQSKQTVFSFLRDSEFVCLFMCFVVDGLFHIFLGNWFFCFVFMWRRCFIQRWSHIFI